MAQLLLDHLCQFPKQFTLYSEHAAVFIAPSSDIPCNGREDSVASVILVRVCGSWGGCPSTRVVVTHCTNLLPVEGAVTCVSH